MLSCVSVFLFANIANIYIFLQSMLNWNIISSYIKVIIILTGGRKKEDEKSSSPKTSRKTLSSIS